MMVVCKLGLYCFDVSREEFEMIVKGFEGRSVKSSSLASG